MKRRFDIVIAGGGMIGLTAAALLAAERNSRAFRITVVDAGVRPRFSQADDVGLRVSALSLGTVRALDEIGVWNKIRDTRAGDYSAMQVWDSRSSVEGPETLRFDAADFALAELGFIVENELVRHTLFAALLDTDVDLKFGTGVDSLEPRANDEGFDVLLADGARLSPDLLIAADGASSPSRRAAGIATKSWRYPQSALVTHVQPAANHRNTAWQRFLSDGPIALLPLADGRASVVWSSAPDRIKAMLLLDDTELGRKLTAATDGVLGGLTVAGPKASFPLRAQHAVRYSEVGVVLIGDAAHSVHPLAGQGANLGFADAVDLAEVLTTAVEDGEYPGDLPTLRRYERRRRGANAAMLHFIDGLNRLFMADSRMLSSLRRRGMRLFNRSGPIRREAVQAALGINV